MLIGSIIFSLSKKMSKFSFDRDLKNVKWGATIQLNMMRVFFASIIWIPIIALSGSKSNTPIFAIPFIAPIAYICILPLLIATLSIIDKVPILLGGRMIADIVLLILPFFVGIVIAIGDPLVFALQKFQPSLVPMQKFNFVNFVWCIFVLNP
jgi:hypothetical protein